MLRMRVVVRGPRVLGTRVLRARILCKCVLCKCVLRARVLRARVLGTRVQGARVLRARFHVEARLQPSEGLDAWIRFLNRHAPTWRPLAHRYRHTSAARRSRRIGPPCLDRSLPCKKDRPERTLALIVACNIDPE